MQSAPVNSGEVELEWLEIPAFLITERQPDAGRDTCILIPASPGTDVQIIQSLKLHISPKPLWRVACQFLNQVSNQVSQTTLYLYSQSQRQRRREQTWLSVGTHVCARRSSSWT